MSLSLPLFFLSYVQMKTINLTTHTRRTYTITSRPYWGKKRDTNRIREREREREKEMERKRKWMKLWLILPAMLFLFFFFFPFFSFFLSGWMTTTKKQTERLSVFFFFCTATLQYKDISFFGYICYFLSAHLLFRRSHWSISQAI